MNDKNCKCGCHEYKEEKKVAEEFFQKTIDKMRDYNHKLEELNQEEQLPANENPSYYYLTFDKYQNISAETAIYLDKLKFKFPDLPPEIYKVLAISYVANGLGECGEVQGKVKKIIRDAGSNITEETIKEISKEIGDILWYCAAMCRELNISLGKVAEDNIQKLLSRKERGVITGSGDNR